MSTPFATTVQVYPTPWNKDTLLMHIGIKGYDIQRTERPDANLVFLLDVSGSMDEPDKLPLVKAFQIGCCQILSIIPGVSRSGATILGGELLGVDRRAATLFTFYLAVPTMVGATIKELHDKGGALTRAMDLDIAIGFVVSFVVAFFVIRGFLQIVTKYGLKPFGWYRVVLGMLVLWVLAR